MCFITRRYSETTETSNHLVDLLLFPNCCIVLVLELLASIDLFDRARWWCDTALNMRYGICLLDQEQPAVKT